MPKKSASPHRREPVPPYRRDYEPLIPDGAECGVCGATLVSVIDSTGTRFLLHPHQVGAIQ